MRFHLGGMAGRRNKGARGQPALSNWRHRAVAKAMAPWSEKASPSLGKKRAGRQVLPDEPMDGKSHRRCAAVVEKGRQSFIVTLGHHGILRTMEALKAHVGDFALKVPLGSGYLSLPDNKTSTRHGRKRQSRLRTHSLLPGLVKLCEGKAPGGASALFQRQP